MSLVTVTEADHGLRIVALNRPDKLNALSGELIDELIEASKLLTSEAKEKAIRSVMFVSSSPKAFCVGADLAERLKMDAAGVKSALSRLRAMNDGIADIPVPTMAVLEGAAFGGGFELALACDFRFCSPGAQMGLTETRLAIIPGAGGTQRLTRLVGLSLAKELVFLAKRVGGEEAARLGLVNSCVNDPKTLATEWARDIALAAPIAVRQAKLAMEEGFDLQLSQGLDTERRRYEELIDTEDRVEGLKAFTEKRSPVYKGR